MPRHTRLGRLLEFRSRILLSGSVTSTLPSNSPRLTACGYRFPWTRSPTSAFWEYIPSRDEIWRRRGLLQAPLTPDINNVRSLSKAFSRCVEHEHRWHVTAKGRILYILAERRRGRPRMPKADAK